MIVRTTERSKEMIGLTLFLNSRSASLFAFPSIPASPASPLRESEFVPHLLINTDQTAEKMQEKVLMVPPKYFKVQYKINPWMDISGEVDQILAQEQWENLRTAIEQAGVLVEVLEPVDGLPDMVFVSDSAIVYNNKVYLSKFRFGERSGEEEHYEKWFIDNGFELLKRDSEFCFEGSGDACISLRYLFAGCGLRSDKAVYEEVIKLGRLKTIPCELALPQFFHLDMCFCVVDDKTAMWYPPGLAMRSRRRIASRLPNLIELNVSEANAFVCNSLIFGNTIISPLGITDETVQKLETRGYSVVQVDMSEFIKAGGACHCLALKLSNGPRRKTERKDAFYFD